MGNALELRGLVRRYGRHTVLRGLDLTLPEGAVYGFLGRNGAGKTTALSCVAGVLRATAGELVYFGEAVRGPSLRHRAQMGFVSQSCTLYPSLTGQQHGRFLRGVFRTWDPALFEDLLRRLDVPGAQSVEELSGGTQVKLAFALALAHRPRLLVLDEPTAGLDPVARRELLDAVTEASAEHGHTTLFSSHIVEEVERVATHVGVLGSGTMAWEGPLATLRAEACFVAAEAPAVGAVRTADGAVRRVGWCREGQPGGERPSLEEVFLAMTASVGDAR